MTPTNAKDYTPERKIHCLMIGPSGAGKTAAAASFPGKTVILDWDDRAKGPLQSCEFLQERVNSGQIEVYRILPWRGTTPVGLKEVYGVLEIVDAKVSRGQIDNVIVDGTTSMRRFFVNDSINRELATSGRSNSLAHFKIGEAILGQKQDHNYAAQCMLNIIYDNLKTFPCNVFVSTHIKDKTVASPTPEDPERVIVVGETITAPGQLTIEIPGWFDEVWEFMVDTSNKMLPPKRYVIFQGKWARTGFRDVGYYDEKKNWVKAHKLDITDKSLYEMLKPTLDRMKAKVTTGEVVTPPSK
jgi:hypothetical protein